MVTKVQKKPEKNPFAITDYSDTSIVRSANFETPRSSATTFVIPMKARKQTDDTPQDSTAEASSAGVKREAETQPAVTKKAKLGNTSQPPLVKIIPYQPPASPVKNETKASTAIIAPNNIPSPAPVPQANVPVHMPFVSYQPTAGTNMPAKVASPKTPATRGRKLQAIAIAPAPAAMSPSSSQPAPIQASARRGRKPKAIKSTTLIASNTPKVPTANVSQIPTAPVNTSQTTPVNTTAVVSAPTPVNTTVVVPVPIPAPTPVKRGRKPKAIAPAPISQPVIAPAPVKRGRKPKAIAPTPVAVPQPIMPMPNISMAQAATNYNMPMPLMIKPEVAQARAIQPRPSPASSSQASSSQVSSSQAGLVGTSNAVIPTTPKSKGKAKKVPAAPKVKKTPVFKAPKKVKAKFELPAEARQYLSSDMVGRVTRAMQQKMFVISREPLPEDLTSEKFEVLGSIGNNYTVTVGSTIKCTCMDFALRHRHCKHILMTFIKVYRLPWQSKMFKSLRSTKEDREQARAHSPLVDPSVLVPKAIRERIMRSLYKNHPDAGPSNEPKPERRPLDTSDCPICFEEFEEANIAQINFCKTCGNNVHKDCFDTWKSAKGANATCVYCRSVWIAGDAPEVNTGPQKKSVRELDKDHVHEGYYANFANELNIERKRDTSTYYNGGGCTYARNRLNRYNRYYDRYSYLDDEDDEDGGDGY